MLPIVGRGWASVGYREETIVVKVSHIIRLFSFEEYATTSNSFLAADNFLLLIFFPVDGFPLASSEDGPGVAATDGAISATGCVQPPIVYVPVYAYWMKEMNVVSSTDSSSAWPFRASTKFSLLTMAASARDCCATRAECIVNSRLWGPIEKRNWVEDAMLELHLY